MERPSGLIKRRGGVQVHKVRFEELLNESRECFERANFCNQSKLFHYVMSLEHTKCNALLEVSFVGLGRLEF